MTKPLKQGEMIVKGDIVAVPATKRPPNGFKRFRILREIADHIVEEHERLCAMQRSLWQRQRRPSNEPLPDVEDGQLAQWVLDDVARCRALLEEIDREDRYEEDEEGDRVLKKAIVAARLALAIANARVGAKSSDDADASAEMLVAHVFDAEPDYLVLEDACRDIEATQKFVPATAEVLEKIDEHRGLWFKRQHAIDTIESTSRELQNEIRQAHARFEAEKAEEKIKRADLNLRNGYCFVNHAKQQVIEKQEAARKAYQDLEAAMARLAKCEGELDAAAVALAEAIEARKNIDEGGSTSCRKSTTS